MFFVGEHFKKPKKIQKSENDSAWSGPDLSHQLVGALPCHPVFVHVTAPQRLPHGIGETESSTESTKKPHFSLGWEGWGHLVV